VNWIRSTLTDDNGRFDVAYVSLFGVMGAVIGAIGVMCVLSAFAFYRCVPVVRETVALVTCSYDPQPLGIAIGAACGGFATALGALAGYMLATRPPRPAAPVQQPSPVNIQMQPQTPPPPADGPEAIAILQPPAKLADPPKAPRKRRR